MPTYEYECTKCGAVVELFQSITEPARKKLKKNDPKACDCHAPVQRRIGTGAGLIFKGSGFYITDYRSESYKNAAKAEKESSSPKDKGTEKGKTDKSDTSKPTKTDNKPSGSAESSGKSSKPRGATS